MRTSADLAADGAPLIGIIEDDPIMGESLMQRLQLENYRAIWWQSGEDALAHLPSSECQVVISDIRLPDVGGEQLFKLLLPHLGATPIIFITAFGEVEQAVRLMQAGADDYITKPFEVETLLSKIATLCLRKSSAGKTGTGPDKLSASSTMRAVELELHRVTDLAAPVLLLGETGVGKEVAALQLHQSSMRAGLPFIVVSCATLPIDRCESILFGHERGSVPGQRNAREGFVEQAGDGTLYLDEVSALPLALQSKLLRLLESGLYRKVGGNHDIRSTARIVSSSNADLLRLVADGSFRSDLFYRLNAIQLRIPPLRARREDILPITEHYLVRFARETGHRHPTLAPSAREALLQHAWPGNIRELRNRLHRAVSLSARAPHITAQAIFPEDSLSDAPTPTIASLAEARDRAERRQIEEALNQTKGEIAKAAMLLRVSRTTLWEKMRRLGL
jgi:DNA-binding NtrC family response regulator